MQNCSNCGVEVKPGIKFCTKCGKKMAEAFTPKSDMERSQVQTTNFELEDSKIGSSNSGQSATSTIDSMMSSEKMDQLKRQSRNYFNWFKKSLFKPSAVDDSNKYFGIVSFVICSILAALSYYAFANKILAPVHQTLSESNSILSNGKAAATIPTGFGLFIKLLMLSLVYFAIFVGVGFLCKKFLVDKQTNIFSYSNQFASFGNSVIVLNATVVVVTFLFLSSDMSSIDAIVGSMGLLLILIGLISTVWTVAFVASIITTKNTAKLDKLYVAMIAIAANNVAMFFFFKVIASDLTSKFFELLKSMLSMFSA